MIVDIHSHIIPAIDDGSKDMEMTLEMIKNAEENGTREIVATPHYLLEYGETKISEVKEQVKKINDILENEKINVKVYSGQEVYFTERIIEDYIEGNIGTINDSRYMLIEFDMHRFDNNILDTIYELQVRDIVPIIAHPERYKYFREKPSLINDFIDQGYLFQMNGGSIEGRFGESIKKTAETFLNKNIYSFIGSDAHNNQTRNTGINNSLSFVDEMNKSIFENSSKNLLENDIVEFLGEKIKEKKTFFSFFKK